MSVEFFKQKFETKTNEKIIEITKNNKKYVLDARKAAFSILKICFKSNVKIEFGLRNAYFLLGSYQQVVDLT